jgi:hypothetical protein
MTRSTAASVAGGELAFPACRVVGDRNEPDPREMAAGRSVGPHVGRLGAPEGNKEFGIRERSPVSWRVISPRAVQPRPQHGATPGSRSRTNHPSVALGTRINCGAVSTCCGIEPFLGSERSRTGEWPTASADVRLLHNGAGTPEPRGRLTLSLQVGRHSIERLSQDRLLADRMWLK